jgi:hypothetical protein
MLRNAWQLGKETTRKFLMQRASSVDGSFARPSARFRTSQGLRHDQPLIAAPAEHQDLLLISGKSTVQTHNATIVQTYVLFALGC